MTTQAGETKGGFLWKQEHLSPLPIPTGQRPADLLNLIWRKNDVYLDIGTFAMETGFLVQHMMTLTFVVISFWFASDLSSDPVLWLFEAFLMPVIGILVMGPLWWLYFRKFREPLHPPVRFNRQRREVCITEPDGNCWIVPWERVHAIAPTVTNVGAYGAVQSGSLILWFPFKGQEDEPYTPDKKGWVMGLSPGGGTSSMAQWECIRSFMEIGPQAVPEPLKEVRDLSLGQIFRREFRKAVEERGLFLALIWDALLCQLIFNPMGAYWLRKKKLSDIPDLTAPEIVEWSKPLPPEQWAKRSPELERAIAERELDLAEVQTAA